MKRASESIVIYRKKGTAKEKKTDGAAAGHNKKNLDGCHQ